MMKTLLKLSNKSGLSFYTSKKTLRAAFEGFGELIEGIIQQFYWSNNIF